MPLYDVIIVGAGVSGAAICRELSRYRLSIAVLEKEAEPAFGVSKSNSGIIHPGTQNPSRSLKARLCVQGNRLMRKLAHELEVDFKEVGELIVAFNAAEIPVLLDLKKEAESIGVPKLKIVDPAWLRANEPNLNPQALAALYAPTAGILSPYRLVYDLLENSRANAAEIFTQAKVERIDFTRPGFEVATTAGVFKSRYLVNCAGLFADEIAGMCGINDFRVRPRKGEEFILDKKKEHLTRHLLFPLPSKVSKGILIIRTADGNPMLGPTAYDIEDKEDLSTSDQGLKEVMLAAGKMIPGISPEDIIAYFAGLRPTAGDDFIIRREEKVPGMVTVAGIQSPGLTASPAIALMVCGLLREQGLALKKKLFFRSHRRKNIHLFSIPLSRSKRLIRKDKGYGDIVCRCEMVSAEEVRQAIARGAQTMDGIKFRTRAQAGRCHGSFCTSRVMKILSQETGARLEAVTKRGKGSEVIKGERAVD